MESYSIEDIVLDRNPGLRLSPINPLKERDIVKNNDPTGNGTNVETFKKAIAVYPFTYKGKSEDGNFGNREGLLYVSNVKNSNGDKSPKVLGIETVDGSFNADGAMKFLSKVNGLQLTTKDDSDRPFSLDDKASENAIKSFRKAIKRAYKKNVNREVESKPLNKTLERQPDRGPALEKMYNEKNPIWRWERLG